MVSLVGVMFYDICCFPNEVVGCEVSFPLFWSFGYVGSLLVWLRFRWVVSVLVVHRMFLGPWLRC